MTRLSKKPISKLLLLLGSFSIIFSAQPLHSEGKGYCTEPLGRIASLPQLQKGATQLSHQVCQDVSEQSAVNSAPEFFCYTKAKVLPITAVKECPPVTAKLSRCRKDVSRTCPKPKGDPLNLNNPINLPGLLSLSDRPIFQWNGKAEGIYTVTVQTATSEVLWSHQIKGVKTDYPVVPSLQRGNAYRIIISGEGTVFSSIVNIAPQSEIERLQKAISLLKETTAQHNPVLDTALLYMASGYYQDALLLPLAPEDRKWIENL